MRYVKNLLWLLKEGALIALCGILLMILPGYLAEHFLGLPEGPLWFALGWLVVLSVVVVVKRRPE